MSALPKSAAESLEVLQNQYEAVNAVKRSTRNEEATLWANAYLWWRGVDAAELKTLYEANHISFNNTQNINFRPFIKLVSQNEVTETDLNTWTQALRLVHDNFEKHPAHYANDPIGSIAHFIKTQGGKTGARSKYSNSDLDAEDEPQDPGLFELDDKEFAPFLEYAYADFFRTASFPPLQNPPPVHFDANGYGVILVKRDSSGTTYLGSSSDSKLVDELSMQSYTRNLDALPCTIRSVLEPLHIFNIPRTIAKNEAKFLEASRLKDEFSEKKSAKELSHRRLIYRPKAGDFLLSQTGIDSSVVIHANPKAPVIDRAEGDIFMRTSTRQSIETRLLHRKRFNLYTTPDPAAFQANPPEFLASHTVRLENRMPLPSDPDISAAKLEAHISNYRHPSLSFIPFYESFGIPRWQVDAKPNSNNFKWKGSLDLGLLREMDGDVFSRWINAHGPKHKQAEYKILKLRFSGKILSIWWEYNAEDARFDFCRNFDLPSGDDVAPHTQVTLEMFVRPRDFVFLLAQIAELSLLTDLSIEAGEHAIHLCFETITAKYDCWIPACDVKGVRFSNDFVPYNPITTIDPDPAQDPDDVADRDYTELEQAAFEKEFQRLRG